MSASVVPVGRPPAGLVFPPPDVRVAVFDVVGTLVTPRPTVAEAYRDVAARHGVVLDVPTIQSRFRDAWRTEERRDAAARPAHVTSAAREEERWRRIVEAVFAAAPACDAIFADLWEHFAAPGSWDPLPKGAALLEAALAAGLPVALASNFDDRLTRLASTLEPLRRAAFVFTSSDIGWRKPAAEFFRAIERRLDCRPHELVLVGDDADLDLAAGRRAGWRVLGVDVT